MLMLLLILLGESFNLKIEYKPSKELLLVQLVSARNLPPKGTGGTSNPIYSFSN